ncbi:MAG: SNF2-related protein [bacterium]
MDAEAVLRDILTISHWRPDFVVLDEAQRIKNFETKTHRAVQSIPHEHSLVITGTPLENKLEDLDSIVQFSDPTLLTPLWAPLLLRRQKTEVIDNLPEKIENNYYIDLSREQLIDEFRENPNCMVFLFTDSGGVGLNLQNTDCLINFELPWNPAKLNQRIGRVHRIGQKSESINVINLKQELFDAVLEETEEGHTQATIMNRWKKF